MTCTGSRHWSGRSITSAAHGCAPPSAWPLKIHRSSSGGDASELAALAAQAPNDATLVVITSAVLVYLPFAARMRFVETVRALDARWISLEGVRGLPTVRAALPDDGGSDGRFVLALDEVPLAFTGPHGQSLDWITRS